MFTDFNTLENEAIINTGEECENSKFAKTHKIIIEDITENYAPQIEPLEQTFRVIEEFEKNNNGERVMVHCMRGRSRLENIFYIF